MNNDLDGICLDFRCVLNFDIHIVWSIVCICCNALELLCIIIFYDMFGETEALKEKYINL